MWHKTKIHSQTNLHCNRSWRKILGHSKSFFSCLNYLVDYFTVYPQFLVIICYQSIVKALFICFCIDDLHTFGAKLSVFVKSNTNRRKSSLLWFTTVEPLFLNRDAPVFRAGIVTSYRLEEANFAITLWDWPWEKHLLHFLKHLFIMFCLRLAGEDICFKRSPSFGTEWPYSRPCCQSCVSEAHFSFLVCFDCYLGLILCLWTVKYCLDVNTGSI